MSGEELPVVAIVADVYSDYQQSIIRVIGDCLANAGMAALCVGARDASLMHREQSRRCDDSDRLYRDAAKFDVAGYLILSNCIGHNLTDHEIAEFVQQFAAKPVVSMGIKIPDVSSIVFDSSDALSALMQHMTSDATRQQCMFIRGFRDNPDSREREAAFRSALQSRSIDIDESLIIEGNFDVSIAYREVSRVLAAGACPNVVVAASDMMAIGALRALQENGFSVPDDVLVSGFDGLPDSQLVTPALSTIRQSVAEQSQLTVTELLRLLNDRSANAQHRDISCDLIIRESSQLDRDILSVQTPATIESVLQQLHDSLAAPEAPLGFSIEDLVTAWAETARHGTADLHIFIDNSLISHAISSLNMVWWQFVHQKLQFATEQLQGLSIIMPSVTQLRQASTHLESILWSTRSRQELDRLQYQQMHDSLLLGLSACTSLDDIFAVLDHGCDSIGLQRVWLVLNNHEAEADCSSLIYARIAQSSNYNKQVFPSQRMLPDCYAEQWNSGLLVMCPLAATRIHFGYIVFDPKGLAVLRMEAIAAGISQAIGHCRQIDDLESQARKLQETNQTLSKIARFDSLTGLPNRAQFHEYLSAAFQSADKQGQSVALLFFDLDGFKRINDTLGHSMGDLMLRMVARRLKRVLRHCDFLARLGGDEFTVIICDDVAEQGSERIANSILDTLSRPYRLDNQIVNISASIGIAHYPGHGVNAETLIRNADTAMYHAKANGKSCLAWYTHALNSEAIAQLQMDQAMRLGLEQNEFCMHYQPRICIADGSLKGFEALMRWYPEGSSSPRFSPDRFIPVAEQTGFISRLEIFALEAVCQQAAAWSVYGHSGRIALNLSVKRLQEDGIVTQILDCLAQHDVAPDCLELEVTESAMMIDVDSTIEKLNILRNAGINIAIDDFGTGYSSMNYLKQLPVSSLKIDRSFLCDIDSAESLQSADASIVRAIVALGKSLGFQIVAEGVENDSQLHFLSLLGCDEAQGFLFSKPVDAALATCMLNEEMQTRVIPLKTGT